MLRNNIASFNYFDIRDISLSNPVRIAQLSVLTKHCCLHQHHIRSCYQTVFCGSIATVVQALSHLSRRHEFNMLMPVEDWQCYFRRH